MLKIVIRAGLALAGLYTLAIVAAVAIAGDLEQYKPRIAEFVSAEAGLDLKIGKIGYTFAHGFGVRFEDVVATRKDTGGFMFSAREIAVAPSISRSLMAMAPRLATVEIIEPVIKLERSPAGEWNVESLSSTHATSAPNIADAGGAAGILMAIHEQMPSKILVSQGDLALIYLPQAGKPGKLTKISVQGIEASIRGGLFVPGFRVRFTGELPDSSGVPGKGTTVSLRGEMPSVPQSLDPHDIFLKGSLKIAGADISTATEAVSKLLPVDSVGGSITVSGNYEGTADGFGVLEGSLDADGFSVSAHTLFDQPIGNKSIGMSFRLERETNAVRLHRFLLRAGETEFSGFAELAGLQQQPDGQTQPPNLKLSIAASANNIASIKQFVPVKLLPPKAADFVKTGLLAGKIDIKRLEYDGPISPSAGPATSTAAQPGGNGKPHHADQPISSSLLSTAILDMEFSGLDTAIPGLPGKFAGMSGRFIFDHGKLLVKEAKGGYGASSISGMSATVGISAGTAAGDFALKAQLSTADAVSLMPLFVSSEKFLSALREIRSPRGTVAADIKGRIDTASADLVTLDGKTAVSDIGFDLAGDGLPTRSLSGEILFTGREAELRDLKWNAGESEFAAIGKISGFASATPDFNLLMAAQIELSDISKSQIVNLPWLSPANRGRGILSLSLSGNTGDYHLAQTLDLTHTEFRYGPELIKPMNKIAMLDLDGDLDRAGKMTVKRLNINIGKTSIPFTGGITDYWGAGLFDFRSLVKTGNVADLGDMVPLTLDPAAEGTFSGSLDISGGLASGAAKVRGKIDVADATVKMHIFPNPITDFNGTVEISENSIELKNISAATGSTKTRLNASIAFKKPVALNFDIDADSLDVTDFTGPVDDSPGGDLPPDIRAILSAKAAQMVKDNTAEPEFKWNFDVKSKTGKFFWFPYTNLDGNFTIAGDKFVFNKIDFDSLGGDVKITGDLYEHDSFLIIEAGASIRNLDLEQYGKTFPKEYRKLTGKFDGNATFRTMGYSIADLKGAANGSLDFHAKDGILREFVFISKIFSLLNLSSLLSFKFKDFGAEGMPYDKLEATAKIENGVAHTDDFLITSKSMLISATGDTKISDFGLDLLVVVKPFILIDKILSSIPLAGNLFTGDEKSLLLYPFRVTGKIEDPNVELVSIRSVAEGIAGILDRVIKLPSNIVDTVKEMGSKPDDKEDSGEQPAQTAPGAKQDPPAGKKTKP